MVDSTPYEVSLNQYVATMIPNVINHFVCRLCSNVVFEPKECPHCEQPYCFNCQQIEIATKKEWQCRKCKSKEQLVNMHRVVKEVFDQLIFSCPKCQQKRSYQDMLKHIQSCAGEGQQLPVAS